MKIKSKFIIILVTFSVAPLVVLASAIFLLYGRDKFSISQLIGVFLTTICVATIVSTIFSIVNYKKLFESIEEESSTINKVGQGDFNLF